MTEQNEIIGHLQETGILDATRWAYTSAVSRTLGDYSEDAGHNATWLGTTRHTLFCDRLDRVFASGRYQLRADSDPSSGLDLVYAELTERDKLTMPTLSPGLVQRSFLKGSPGWRFGDRRFLLASCAYGKISRLPWSEKSETKQQVAKQQNPDPHPSLFDDFELDGVEWLVPALEEVLDLETFVVGHTLDAVGQRSQLVFGRPRINAGGGDAWHWYENLDHTPPTSGGHRLDQPQSPAPDLIIPDAPVRLRRPAAEQRPQARRES
ncbi:hypothetical protein [Arthrobacter sp. HLT1-20]